MVDSIQFSICKPERLEVGSDGNKLKIPKQSNWEFIQ